jgi:hypothetical protein
MKQYAFIVADLTTDEDVLVRDIQEMDAEIGRLLTKGLKLEDIGISLFDLSEEFPEGLKC